MSLPSTMKAVILQDGQLVLKDDVPIPQLSENSMLIKTKAVGANPFEHILVDFKIAPEGCIMGSDVVGEIVQIGKEVDPKEFHIGDVVASVVMGGTVQYPDGGAYAEYVRVYPKTVFKFPKDLTYCGETDVGAGIFNTWEACASFPMVFYTALAGTFYELKLKLEWQPEKPQNDHPILIWGGATGVGQYAIQFVKQVHGFTKIIVVASKKHETLLKSYGADEVFDYHDEDVIEQITSKYDNLQTLMDCRSRVETINQTYKCGSKNGPVTLMEYAPSFVDCIDIKDQRDNIRIITTNLYQMNDVPIIFGPATIPVDPAYRAKILEAIKFFNPKLINGDIKHTPLKVYKGLDGAIEMVNDIKDGKNSGVKFVSVL